MLSCVMKGMCCWFILLTWVVKYLQFPGNEEVVVLVGLTTCNDAALLTTPRAMEVSVRAMYAIFDFRQES